ncbi:MAG TPA: EamA family transporter [Acidiferrobacteraceae bacterium]|nr:EamA family transporter [Acidiferrobacteraceae bacterium]
MSVPAAYLGLIGIWTTTPLAIKWSGEGANYLFAVSARMAIGMIFVMIFLKLVRSPLPWHKKARQTYFTAGMGIYGAMLAVYWGAQFVPSGLIAVIFGLSPWVTTLFAILWLHEPGLNESKFFGLVAGLIGLGLVFGGGPTGSTDTWYGVIAILVAVVIHAASAVWIKRIGSDLSAISINVGGLMIAVVLYLLTWAIFDGQWPTQISQRAGMAILYLGLFGTAVGFSLYYYALKKLPAATMALITLVTPVSAMILGRTLNNEVMATEIWVGTGFILGGLLLHHWGQGLWQSVVVICAAKRLKPSDDAIDRA